MKHAEILADCNKHTGFAHAATFVLTYSLQHHYGTTSLPGTFLTTTRTNTASFNYPYTSLTSVQTTCFIQFIFSFSLPYTHIFLHFCLHFHIPAHHQVFIDLFKPIFAKNYVSIALVWSQYSPRPVPTSVWFCPSPNYHPSTFDTICKMLNGYSISQVFCNPIPHNDIGYHALGILITPWFMVLNSAFK